MRHHLPSRLLAGALIRWALVAWVVCADVSPAGAQDAEPRTYSNAPVGMNFAVVGYALTDGGLAFDPSLPFENEELRTHNALLAYARVLDLWGKSAKLDVIVPFTWLSGSAEFMGEEVERSVRGFADGRARLSVNFHGAPALRLPEYAGYRQDLIVGASLQVNVPWGQYDDERLVNIGQHRGWFKPELGLSKAIGPWTIEFAAAVTFFTENGDFFGGLTRAQDPVAGLQWHLIRGFRSGVWAAFDVAYFTGGRTTLGDAESNDLQNNWRLGGMVAIPIDRLNSIKFQVGSGVYARTGNNFDAVAVAWQHRWGGGL